MSAEENKEVVRRLWGLFEQAISTNKSTSYWRPATSTTAPGCPPSPRGLGVKEILSMFRSGIPDARVVIDDMIDEGDKVAVRYTIEGTHEGDLFGVPPTGQRVSIEKHWRVTDTLDMMQQLGAIPTPEHA